MERYYFFSLAFTASLMYIISWRPSLWLTGWHRVSFHYILYLYNYLCNKHRKICLGFIRSEGKHHAKLLFHQKGMGGDLTPHEDDVLPQHSPDRHLMMSLNSLSAPPSAVSTGEPKVAIVRSSRGGAHLPEQAKLHRSVAGSWKIKEQLSTRKNPQNISIRAYCTTNIP